MAIPQLTDEAIRTWPRERKDRWWLENVFRGDMPQLTLRAALTGFLLGGILSATNLYIGAKTGWTLGVGVTSVILSFVVFRTLARLGIARDMTILENNAVQSIATAAGYMTGPLISVLMAYMFVTNTPLHWVQMLVWNVVASLLGVLVAFPMKRRFINDEQQPFPEGRACAIVLDSLYPDAPPGGTRNMIDGVPVPAPAGTAARGGGVDLGVFKAQALGAAAALGAVLQFLVATGYQAIIQIRLLGVAKAKDGLWKIPERLDEWWYRLAAQHPGLWLPRVHGVTFEQLGVTVAFDLAMVGAGGLMGMRIATSVMIGMMLNYLVLAPAMIARSEILPKNFTAIAADDRTYPLAEAVFGRVHLLNSWCLWWGVGMMVSASMVGLFAKPRVLLSAFGGLFARGRRRDDALADIELPLWISIVGVPMLSALIIWLDWRWFGVKPWLGALSIPLILVLTLIAANATALTSTTPTGSLSKITQFTFGSLDPGHAATNLMTAGVTSEVASNASNLLMDIKPGYMLGARPRQQAWGHCIGILAGAIASTPLFFVLFLWQWTPAAAPIKDHVTERWAMPGAVQWAAIAEVIRGMGAARPEGAPLVELVDGVEKLWGVLPVSAAWAMVVGAIAAAVLEILRIATRGRFPLSAVAIGLGVVLPPESSIMMWIGAFVFWVAEILSRRSVGSFAHRLWIESKEAVAAGLIAGWALVGIGDGIIAAVTRFPDTTAEVEEAEARAAGSAEIPEPTAPPRR